jgi:ADP-ribose pyrophosphatase YjhB (NUDIX family)
VVYPLPSLAFPPVSERRHGEVCMAIRRKTGGFLLQTKRSYPGQVMRLPTGGIRPGEDLQAALLREIWEETNLDVEVEAYVARIRYRAGDRRSRFVSNLFVVRETGGELRSNDPRERISAWVEARPEELEEYADKLRRMNPAWADWGIFRAASLEILASWCDASAARA